MSQLFALGGQSIEFQLKNEVGQQIKVKIKEKRFQDGDMHPGEGVLKEEEFLHTQTPSWVGMGVALEPQKAMPS